MPAALPFLAAFAAPAGTAFTISGIAVSYAALAYVGTSVAVGIYQADRARKQANRLRDSFDQGLRTVNIRSAISPRQLVLGTVRAFGVPAYTEFVGSNQEYLDQIIAFSSNEVSIGGVFFDDELVTAANIASQVPTTGKFANANTVRVSEQLTVSGSNTITLAYTPLSPSTTLFINTDTAAEYSVPVTFSGTAANVVNGLSAAPGTLVRVEYSRAGTPPMRVQFATGSAGQASTTWSGVSTPKWTSNHRLRGMGYVRTLELVDDTVYANGLPQVSVLATMASQVWDPRASGGAGAYVTGSDNPALLAAWYRTLARDLGGMGIPAAWIDWPSVAAAANICDETITVKTLDGSSTESIKRYTCNTVLTLAHSRNDNLRIILSAMAGDFPFTGGYYKCYAGAYRAPVYTVTDADVAAGADIEFAPNAGDYQKPPNIMAATIFDAAKNYNETGAPEVVNSSYVTSDGGEEIGEADLPATTDSRRANYLMGVRLEQLRPGHTVRLRLGGVAADFDLFTALQFNLTGHSVMAGFVFEIRKWSNNFDGTYDVECVQSKSTTWALDADRYTPVSVTAPPDLSYIWAVATPANVQIFSGSAYSEVIADGTRISRLRVTWDSHSQAYVRERGHIEIRWKRAAADWIYESPLPGSFTEAYLKPITDAALYIVEVRATNPSGGFSEWATPSPHIAAITGNNEQDLQLVTHGTAGAVVVRGTSVVKIASGGAWNAGVHSKASIAGACRAVTVAGEINRARVLALNSDPTTDAGYAGLDYAIYLRADAVLEIYESGTSAGTFGAYASGDVIEIVYTGPVVTYKRNGTALRTIAVALSLSLSLDSSLYDTGATLTNLGFEALTPKPAQYRLSTYGAGVTSPPADVTGALVNAEAGATVRAGARSYLLARISRTTGLPTFSQVYDVYASSSNAASLVTDLDATDSSSIVVVWGYDEPLANRLTSGLEDALYKHGASRQVFGASDFRYRSAYILIGIGQCGEGQGWEAYRGATDNAADAYLQVGFIVTTAGELIVNGASYTPGAQSLPPGVSGNLLANSSCEFDTDSNGMPDSWAAYNSGTVGTVTYSINSGGVAGSKYLTVSATNLGTGTGDEAGARQIVDLTGLQNQPIAFSTYAQGGGSGAPDMRLYVDYYSAAGGTGTIVGSTHQAWPSLDSAWRRFVHYSRVPSGAVSCRAYCWMEARKSAAGAAAMNFDAVQFEVSTMATGYAPRLEAPGAVGTDQIVPGANTNAPVETSIADDFDDATTAEGPFNTYRTYEDGDGLRAIGSITPFGTSRVNIVVTGAVRIHCGSTSATVADITIKLRNGTTVIDEAFGRFGVVTRYDPVGTGKSVEIPVSLSWQGDLSAATTFNIDVVVTCYQSDGSTVAPFNTGSNGGYVLFKVKSTIVNYKR